MSITRRLVAAALPLAAFVPAVAHARPAPDFTAIDADGKTRSLSEFRGKTVVLEWTNEGCPYVRKHYSGNMQGLQQAARADGVVWLTIASSAPGKQGHFADGAAAKAWMNARGAKPTALLLDADNKVATLYKAKTTPHMFVIDKTGAVVYEGAIDDKPTNKVEDIQGSKNLVAAALGDLKAGRKVATPFVTPYGCSVKYKDA
ncbi:thioredoxin family protein [Caulobacter vibrioides]|uniref:Thioredoxin domain-containing protein n=2 Tax=Caulobacter vibrioides TaxID=155892 RepID=Q9ABK7_CAUVC|nr:thioredoxin family protein [Caulobacter vibrioides]YP_002515595.1 thiol-disulfide isomerase and thioredoxin [Caulobacter vibrioides NA1000]AAK22207.1 conserved hypothetical protein [Caulobacter vibrioides CB15]ACL93687.1 thiol-disulfide isomerase and thioredoxin [Caulobacter vibrioides NA1000]ATC23233.1 thioredoxin family protein [Caulobacter vibrioides]ATC27052.1 thioredoxin family protein [Caulobacter vibrioides]AZH11441.1 thioredoxin family protein [Caulobacter vibrioides]